MAKLSELTKALEKIKKETLKEVREIVADHGSDLLNKAERDLIKAIEKQEDIDEFKNIHLDMTMKSDSNVYSVIVGDPAVGSSRDSHMAAYLEFGTGLNFHKVMADNNYPQEIKDLAKNYIVNKRGTLIGSPYLFNNYYKVRDNFVKELNSFLKTDVKI